MSTRPTNVLLSGTVGSTAYGLATPDSDVDTLGVYAEHTRAFWGLDYPKETYGEKDPDPDLTLHEARKYARLALAGNPTILELLWLPEDLLQVHTSLGRFLRDIRSSFLSGPRVRAAYLGYATQQFERLRSRQDGSFSADTRKRTAKHARHMARLCWQGLALYTDGYLPIEIPPDDRDRIREFGEAIAVGYTQYAERLLRDTEEGFNRHATSLPDQPDKGPAEDWLRNVRWSFL